MIDPTGGAGGKIVEMAAKGGVVLLLSGTLIFGVNKWLNDRDEAAKLQMATEIKVMQAEHDKKLAVATQAINAELKDKHIQLIEKTADKMLEYQRETAITVTTEDLTERASTEEGRADLNARAAERTGQLMNEIEELSNWNDMYEQTDIGSITQ